MNSKKINLAIGIVNLCVMAIIINVFFFQHKVVYVDSAKLLTDYKDMQAAQAAYQQKAVAWRANMDTLTNEIQQQIFTYEKESSTMSARERQLSRELIRIKQNQLAQYQNALSTLAQQQDQKTTGEVVNQINTYLKTHGESKGYKIILAATGHGKPCTCR